MPTNATICGASRNAVSVNVSEPMASTPVRTTNDKAIVPAVESYPRRTPPPRRDGVAAPAPPANSWMYATTAPTDDTAIANRHRARANLVDRRTAPPAPTPPTTTPPPQPPATPPH